MVFQDYALYPHMNVARNMSFSLRLQKRPQVEIDRRVREVAEMLGLAAFLDRKPERIVRRSASSGWRWGRALCRDASTFLFDEPALEPRCQAPRADAGGTGGDASDGEKEHDLTSPTTRSRR